MPDLNHFSIAKLGLPVRLPGATKGIGDFERNGDFINDYNSAL
jgi:hypothetical protein